MLPGRATDQYRDLSEKLDILNLSTLQITACVNSRVTAHSASCYFWSTIQHGIEWTGEMLD